MRRLDVRRLDVRWQRFPGRALLDGRRAGSMQLVPPAPEAWLQLLARCGALAFMGARHAHPCCNLPMLQNVHPGAAGSLSPSCAGWSRMGE